MAHGYEPDLPKYVGFESETQPTEVSADVDAFSTPISELGHPTIAHSQSSYVPVEDGERVALSMVTAQPTATGGFVTERGIMRVTFDEQFCQETIWQDRELLAAQSVISADSATRVRTGIVPGESHF